MRLPPLMVGTTEDRFWFCYYASPWGGRVILSRFTARGSCRTDLSTTRSVATRASTSATRTAAVQPSDETV